MASVIWLHSVRSFETWNIRQKYSVIWNKGWKINIPAICAEGTNKVIISIPSLYYKFSASIRIFRWQNLKIYFKISYGFSFHI